MPCTTCRSRRQAGRSSQCPSNPAMHRYPHPICTTCPDTCGASEELLRCAVSMLCAQGEALEEIRAMLADRNNL